MDSDSTVPRSHWQYHPGNLSVSQFTIMFDLIFHLYTIPFGGYRWNYKQLALKKKATKINVIIYHM
jgi:hypothetical protein